MPTVTYNLEKDYGDLTPEGGRGPEDFNFNTGHENFQISEFVASLKASAQDNFAQFNNGDVSRVDQDDDQPSHEAGKHDVEEHSVDQDQPGSDSVSRAEEQVAKYQPDWSPAESHKWFEDDGRDMVSGSRDVTMGPATSKADIHIDAGKNSFPGVDKDAAQDLQHQDPQHPVQINVTAENESAIARVFHIASNTDPSADQVTHALGVLSHGGNLSDVVKSAFSELDVHSPGNHGDNTAFVKTAFSHIDDPAQAKDLISGYIDALDQGGLTKADVISAIAQHTTADEETNALKMNLHHE